MWRVKRATRLAVVVVLALGIIVATSGSVAADPQVGTSGNCDDAEGNGGSYAVKIGTDEQNTGGPDEARSGAEGAIWYWIQNDQECDNDNEGGANDDYIEAHVDGGATSLQICEDGDEQRAQPDVHNPSKHDESGHECEFNRHNN